MDLLWITKFQEMEFARNIILAKEIRKLPKFETFLKENNPYVWKAFLEKEREKKNLIRKKDF